MGWSRSRHSRSQVHGAAARMAAMVSPPIPAMAMVLTSSGCIPDSPSHKRKSIRPVRPYFSAVPRARSSGPGRRSEATAPVILPCCSSQTGRYAWSVPTSANRAPRGTSSATDRRRGVSSTVLIGITS